MREISIRIRTINKKSRRSITGKQRKNTTINNSFNIISIKYNRATLTLPKPNQIKMNILRAIKT